MTVVWVAGEVVVAAGDVVEVAAVCGVVVAVRGVDVEASVETVVAAPAVVVVPVAGAGVVVVGVVADVVVAVPETTQRKVCVSSMQTELVASMLYTVYVVRLHRPSKPSQHVMVHNMRVIAKATSISGNCECKFVARRTEASCDSRTGQPVSQMFQVVEE